MGDLWTHVAKEDEPERQKRESTEEEVGRERGGCHLLGQRGRGRGKVHSGVRDQVQK